MSGEYNTTKEYFDFATDLMDEVHDAIALINSTDVDCFDDLELELDEAGYNAKRLLCMAAKKLQDVVMSLDQSSFSYTTKAAAAA